MDHPVSTFRALSSAFQYDAASSTVDTLAAELAAQVARDEHPLLLGLVRRDAVRKFYGLVYLLDGYGLTLRQKYRELGDGVFVYAERKDAVPSEFEGATVAERASEHVTEVPYVFPQAA